MSHHVFSFSLLPSFGYFFLLKWGPRLARVWVYNFIPFLYRTVDPQNLSNYLQKVSTFMWPPCPFMWLFCRPFPCTLEKGLSISFWKFGNIENDGSVDNYVSMFSWICEGRFSELGLFEQRVDEYTACLSFIKFCPGFVVSCIPISKT